MKMKARSYCEFCAWIALTPDSRNYCGAVTTQAPKPKPGMVLITNGDYIQCARVPGHEGDHVACSPSFDFHELVVWENDHSFRVTRPTLQGWIGGAMTQDLTITHEY